MNLDENEVAIFLRFSSEYMPLPIGIFSSVEYTLCVLVTIVVLSEP